MNILIIFLEFSLRKVLFLMKIFMNPALSSHVFKWGWI